MSVMVGIHGIAQQYKGGNELRAQWLPALKDGLTAAGHREMSDTVQDEDLRVSFFGNLFRPKGAMGTEFPPFTAEDLASEQEIKLLTDLYDQALAREPALGPPAGALGPAKVRTQVMLERLLRSRTFANLIPERAFVGNLKQVIRFLGDPKMKKQVLDRVHEEINANTRVLIGHSLGSVIAYEYLCCHRPAGMKLLVTLGSPLGIPNVVFDRLTPAPGPAGGSWPGPVSSWVNVADPDDVVALRKDLAPLFPPPDGVTPIEDRRVDNGSEPHAIGPYLNAAETGGALAAVL